RRALAAVPGRTWAPRSVTRLVRRVRRVDKLALEKLEGRAAIEQEVVERVGEDLGHPDQAGPNAAQEEEMHGAEEEPANANEQPDEPDLVEPLGEVLGGFEDPPERGIDE